MSRVDLNLESLSRLSGVILGTYRFLELFRLKPDSSLDIVQHWFRILGVFKNWKSLTSNQTRYWLSGS